MFFSGYAIAGAVNPNGGVGARSKGLGGAGTAIANDASCFYYNPALLSSSGDFAQMGMDYIYASIKYKDPDGKEYKSDAGKYFVPLFGVNYKLNEKVNFGLGIVTPYCFGSDFKQRLDMFSKLSLTEIAPAVSYKITDRFILGASVKLGLGKIELSQPVYAGNMKIGALDSEADGHGYSFQIGALWQPNDWLNLGASYQSKTRIELEGGADLVSPLLGNLSNNFSAVFYFPARYNVGVGIKTGKFLIAADVVRFDYSATDHIDVNYEQWQDEKLALNWKSNTYYALGVEYSVNNAIKLRGGGAYQKAVIPDSTVNPATPDMDGWLVGCGIGWQGNNFGVDISYLHCWGNKREIAAPNQGAGEYKAAVDIVSVAVIYRF
ncbi:MAG: outer membrane protein transport protein [bacterium]|nr:outer membrane protein transport protein [bacterium]